MEARSATSELARFIAETHSGDIPARLYERAKELLIDHVGVVFGGLDLRWSRIIRARALADGGPLESTVYGGGKVSTRNAALANATIAHAVELDDTHIASLSHLSSVVFPAALAVAEARGIHGKEFLAAYILGCEAMGRIGRAAGQELLNAGFHPTSANGVFGAAAASAVLLKLDAKQTENAFGIALSMASGSMQFSLESEGTMVKRLHAGLPADRGILAALLAAEGFSAPGRSIEGQRGFLKTFARGANAAPVTNNLGEEFMIDDMSIKLNACCLHFAAMIDAITECANEISGDALNIERIEVKGPKALLNGHMEYRPRSVMAAQYSLPYVAAATLLLDISKLSSFEEAARQRADLIALSDRVTAAESPKLEKLFPAKFPAAVSIHFANGKTVARTVEDARGTASRPLTRNNLVAKFRALSDDSCSGPLQDDILAAIDSIDEPRGVTRLTGLLGNVSQSVPLCMHQRN